MLRKKLRTIGYKVDFCHFLIKKMGVIITFSCLLIRCYSIKHFQFILDIWLPTELKLTPLQVATTSTADEVEAVPAAPTSPTAPHCATCTCFHAPTSPVIVAAPPPHVPDDPTSTTVVTASPPHVPVLRRMLCSLRRLLTGDYHIMHRIRNLCSTHYTT